MQDSPVYNLGNYHENNEQVNYTYSPWLKKSLDFNFLKCSKMKNLSQFLTEYLHHGCKKFCISIWYDPNLSLPVFKKEIVASKSIFLKYP